VTLSDEAITTLKRHAWPGNVRELSNLIERLSVLHPAGNVRAADLPPRYRGTLPGEGLEAAPVISQIAQPQLADTSLMAALAEPVAVAPVAAPVVQVVMPMAMPSAASDTLLPAAGIDLRNHIANIELDLIRAALAQAGGVVAHAAPLLGLRRTTLVEKLRKYGIDREASDAMPAVAAGF
jgi:sigma-54 specific flagellar transcriptional regulator A